MSPTSTITLLGGPSSGKTTYLGALIDALRAERTPNLLLGDLPDDAEAYNRLAEPLWDGAYPQRTKAERNTLDLPLRATQGERVEEVSLSMGDYDGEEVERLFKDRTQGFSPEWKARADARGILLFLRPDALTPLPQLTPHLALTDQERMQALKTGEAPKGRASTRSRVEADPEAAFGPGLQAETPEPRIAGPRDAVQVPTVLAVIELLQFLRHVRGLEPGERPPHGEMRVALLSSAWDALDKAWQRRGPASFFAERAPLLEDFLWSNYHPDDVFRFGLSSTAGDLRDARYQGQYLDDPHGFVVWTDASGALHKTRNLALPVEWALFGDSALEGQDDLDATLVPP